MSRGRPPSKARKDAGDHAAQWGKIMETGNVLNSRIDFILFERLLVVFVRVKRSHSRIHSPEELRILFSAEIAGIREIPMNAVVSRELWVFLPWGTWQYFRVGDDSITEIHDDRESRAGTDENSGSAPVLRDPSHARPGRWDAFSPGPGFICPYAPR